MSKIPVIFKIKLTVEEAKDKIGIWKESHRKPRNRPPSSNLLIAYRFSNNRTCQRMGDAIHKIMITWESS